MRIRKSGAPRIAYERREEAPREDGNPTGRVDVYRVLLVGYDGGEEEGEPVYETDPDGWVRSLAVGDDVYLRVGEVVLPAEVTSLGVSPPWVGWTDEEGYLVRSLAPMFTARVVSGYEREVHVREVVSEDCAIEWVSGRVAAGTGREVEEVEREIREALKGCDLRAVFP